jgi:hypothetical protein
MRALSLIQPWAWLVLHAGKDIENRVWNTRFRGEFLIHASKGMTADDYIGARDLAASIDPALARSMPPLAQVERGGIVGIATLVDVLPPTETPRAPWHMPGQYGFRLRSVHPLPFLPCKGSRGWWGSFAIRDGKAVQL